VATVLVVVGKKISGGRMRLLTVDVILRSEASAIRGLTWRGANPPHTPLANQNCPAYHSTGDGVLEGLPEHPWFGLSDFM